MSVNKILISALALFIGLGIMASAGSILNDAERYLKEIEITIIEVENSELPTHEFILTDYVSTLDAEYLYNNFENLYSFSFVGIIPPTWNIIDNGTILDSNFDFGTGAGGSKTITNGSGIDVITYNAGGTYVIDLEESVYTYNGQNVDIFSQYTLTITFTWQLDQFTTLGRLTNVATITMVIAILSTATYFTLKGRAKA